MIIWKVVRIGNNGRLYSSTVDGVFRIEYKLDGEVTPEIGGIFAFTTHSDALEFYRGCVANGQFRKVDYQLWEAETPKVRVPPCRIASYVASSGITRFWEAIDEHRQDWEENRWYVYSTRPPRGTVLCDSITLRRRVK